MPKIFTKPVLTKPKFLAIDTPKFRSIALAILSGVLMSLAAAPLNAWGLAWIALSPLWILIVRYSKHSTSVPVILAFFWGVAYHGISLHWITGLHPLMWLGVPWIASVLIVAFALAFITLWGTVCVCIWARGMVWMSQRDVAPGVRVLVGTALWCALETIRQWTPLDWTSLSFTQSPSNLVILHLGQISGAMAVTAAIVAVNGLIAEAISTEQGEIKARYRFGVLAIALFAGLHLFGFALYSVPIQQRTEDSLRVGIIQGNVPTRIKLFEDGLKRAFDGYSSGYRSLAEQNVNVVVTPEGALPILWQGLNKTDNAVYRSVLEKRIPAFLGTFVPHNNGYTQSLLAIASNGDEVGRYNKIKLVPLGEYMPFSEILGGLIGRLSPIRSYLLPGDLNQQFETPFGRAAVGICYDSAFGKVFRDQVTRGAQFLITASNLDPYSTVLMEQHQAHDVMRAIENNRWTVRVTNTGYSGIVDPHGRIQWRSQPNQFETYAGQIYRSSTQTLYVQWGDWLTPMLVVISAGALYRHWRSLKET
jgi:apolipoprotein N-acyltransferase